MKRKYGIKYQIIQVQVFNEIGKKTMITIYSHLEKALYEVFTNPHEWIQEQYDYITEYNKAMGKTASRRATGDWIRAQAWKAVT